MWYRKILSGLVMLLLLLGPAACGVQTVTPTLLEPTATTVPSLTLEEGVLTVGLDQAWSPFQFVDDADQAVGFDMDIARAVAEEMGLIPRFVAGDWDAVQVMLRTGEVDIILALTPTEERAKVFDFSDMYITLGIAVFVRSDSSAQRIEDLYGKPMAIEVGDQSAVQALGTHLPQIRAVNVESIEEALSALKDGDVEGAAITKEVGSYQAHQMGLEYYLVLEEQVGSPSTIGVKKGKDALLVEINQALDAIKADETYDHIYDEWFGQQ